MGLHAILQSPALSVPSPEPAAAAASTRQTRPVRPADLPTCLTFPTCPTFPTFPDPPHLPDRPDPSLITSFAMSSCPLVPFWIDGQRATAHSTRRGVVTNPSTGAQIRSVPMADAADIDAAVQSARRAFPGWRATTPLRRARILARFRELLEAKQKAIAK